MVHDVFFVIDASGSMSSYRQVTYSAVKYILSTSPNDSTASYKYHFISFSTNAFYSEDIDELIFENSSTNIVAGFKLLNERLELETRQAESKQIIIFVSDGEDSDPATVVVRLQALGRGTNSATTVFFAVAVGNGFPTGMVVEALRPAYHNASECLPLVFPVSSPECMVDVFATLANYLFKRDHHRSLGKFDGSSTLDELDEGVDDVYNYYLLKCSQTANLEVSLALLNQAKTDLSEIAKLSSKFGDDDTPDKPLASRLLNRKAKQHCKTSVTNALTRINQYIDATVKGQLLAKLSDADKQKVLAYGCSAGKHLVASLKYHRADLHETTASLIRCLEAYDEVAQAAANLAVSDSIISQHEALVDARACVAYLHCDSLVGLLDVFPVVCRLLNVQICAGTQINPFLVHVLSLPAIVQHMNSVDFFTKFKGEYASHDETANCLMPVTQDRSPHNFLRHPCGAHLASFFLCKNVDLRFRTALLGMQAAVVTYCLQAPPSQWIDSVMQETYESLCCIYDEQNSPQLFRYLDLVKGPNYHKALVTQSDMLPAECTCEHLTKFVLATYMLIRRGHAFTSTDLRLRMMALLSEMVGRAGNGGGDGKDLASCFGFEPVHTSLQLLDMVDRAEALSAYTLAEAIKSFQVRVNDLVCESSAACGGRLLHPVDIPHKYFQFSNGSISRIFAGLSRLAGHDVAVCCFFQVHDPFERLEILRRGYAGGSLERNVTYAQPQVIGEFCGELHKNAGDVEAELVRRHVKAVRAAAPGYLTKLYQSAKFETHQVIWPLPAAYVQRYKDETGRDADVEFEVNPETRLPRRACSSPACKYFLRQCTPSFSRDGTPLISNELAAHLEHAAPVAGLFRAVSLYLATGEGHDISELDMTVREGGHLLPCGTVIAERKVEQIVRALKEIELKGESLSMKIARTRQAYLHPEEHWTYEEFCGWMEKAYQMINLNKLELRTI